MNWKKLFHFLYESLPAKSRIYFLYTHKNGFDRFKNGLKSNTEISYWCYSALRAHFPRVRFLRFEKENRAAVSKIRPADVVIGHVGETFALASQQTKRLIAFYPWVGHEDHSKEGFNSSPKEIEIGYNELAHSMIWLTSEYNVREYLEKPRNFWYDYYQKTKQRKRIRIVHQPIDLTLFRRIKWNYQTNDFLYIGNSGAMKGLDDAKKLSASVCRRFTIYGVDGTRLNHLDHHQVSQLPEVADFFLQPGMWEAQCVSILEAAARGFIPVVTPETGYPYFHPFLLRYGDFGYNLQRLKDLLNLTAEEKQNLANQLHQQLVNDMNHNNWEKLTSVLCEEVKYLFSQRIEH